MVDSTRIFLFFAFGLLSFMLWNAWQQDFSLQPGKVQVADASGVPTPMTTPLPEAAAAQKIDRQFIHVRTDVLDIVIDPAGGDIVSANLPAYPQELHSQQPFTLLSNEPEKLYIAQSGVVSQALPEPTHMLYQAKQTDYSLASAEDTLSVILTWRNNQGLVLTKTFIFKRNDYTVSVDYQIKNQSSSEWQGNFYTLLKRKNVQPSSKLFHFNTYSGAAISSPAKPYEKISFSKIQQEGLDRTVNSGWIAMLQHYFLSAWVPDAKENYRYYTKAAPDNTYIIGMLSPAIKVESGQEVTTGAKLYIGPGVSERLKAVAPHLDLTIDYGWLWFISGAIFWLMKHIYSIVGNWGWAIVLVTVLIKALFYKLSATSYRSMANLRKLQPQLEALKQRFGEDKQKFSQATMELYRKEKVNPLGGCLPILVQIPVFLALYWVLIESVELRQAPFILWIHDLAAKDPYYVLPLIMGITIFIQQRLNPPPADPIQAKVLMLLPVIFTTFFLNFPAGLVLYWVVNNTLSIVQQWFITKRLEQQGLAIKN